MEKGNAFLVDTKTICFMCFKEKQTKTEVIGVKTTGHPIKKDNSEEIPSADTVNELKIITCESGPAVAVVASEANVEPVKQEEQVKEDVVNGTNVSAKRKRKPGPGFKKEKSAGPFSFRLLARYLKINLQKVFSLNVPFHSVHLLDKTELRVSLCSKCFPVANRFMKLCEELELIQMKIQGCVERVHEVISEADKDKVLVDNYRKLMVTPNPLDLIQAGITDNLRKEILEKCHMKMQRALPRVRLEKVEVTSPEDAFVIPGIDTPKLDLKAILTEENYLESIRRSASVIFTASSKSFQDQSNFKLETVMVPPSNSNSVENMDFINESDSSNGNGVNGTIPLPQIVASNYDIEMLDSDPLGPSMLPEEEDNVVLDKVSSPPTQHQQTEENDPDDYVKLCKKVVKGQPKYFCEICKVQVTSRQKHKRVVHRESLLKCTYCSKGFAEYRERKLHTTIYHHYEKYLIPLKPIHISEETFKAATETCFGIITENRKNYTCPICDKIHRKTNNLRGHVIDHHFPTFRSKLEEILGHVLNSTADDDANAATLPQTGKNNLLGYNPSHEVDSELEVIAVMENSAEEMLLDQSLSQDLNQSLLTDLDFTLINSSRLESEGSQSPALSQQQQSQNEEVLMDDTEDDVNNVGKKVKSKYIIITGRKADGKPLYYCNLCKKTVTNTIMHKRIHHGEKLLHCEHCNKDVTTAYILREHTAQFHPHELLRSAKKERCSELEFLEIVNSLISDLTKKSVEMKNAGDRQKCPLCTKECKQKGRWFLHLMEQHVEELSQRLEQIQNDKFPETKQEIQQVILVQFQNPSETQTISTIASTSTSTPPPPSTPNQNQSEQSQELAEKKSANHKGNYSEKHRFICDACGSRFTQSSSLKRHEKLYCKATKEQEEENNDPDYHPLAQNLSTSLDSMSSSNEPLPVTTTQIEQIPSTSIVEGLSTIDTTSLNWSIATTTGSGNLGCSYCDKTFMFPYCQRTHLITAHRVETFSEHVPLGTSYEEVETVLSIILQDFNKAPSGMNICNFCAKEYAQVSELEGHVLISHFDEVVVKLKNLVQLREELLLNPNFGASFDNFNLLSEDCVLDGTEDGMENGDGDGVHVFDLDQFPELKAIYSSLSGDGGAESGTAGDGTSAGTGGELHGSTTDPDGIGIGIEQVNDITMGDQLFF